MKIDVNEEGEIVLSQVFVGVGIKTEEGVVFGIAQRDAGVEIGGPWSESVTIVPGTEFNKGHPIVTVDGEQVYP